MVGDAAVGVDHLQIEAALAHHPQLLPDGQRVIVDLSGETVGERRQVLDFHDAPRFHRAGHRVRVLALHAHDADVGRGA